MLVDNILGTYVEPSTGIGQGYGRIASDEVLISSRTELATALGLQLLDSTSVDSSLEARFGKDKPSMELLYRQFNDMLEPTGVEFVRDSTMQDVEPLEEYQALVEVNDALKVLPVEAIADSGTKRITITNDAKTNPVSQMTTIGWVDHDQGMFITPIGDAANTTSHEFWHLWDEQMCPTSNAYWSDHAYARINPGAEGFYTNRSDMKSATTLASHREKITQEGWFSVFDFDDGIFPEPVFTVDKRLAAVNVVTEYGGSNVVEDRAVAGGWLLDPSKADLLFNESSPSMAAKAKLLVGRIAVRDPSLASYFLASRIMYPDVVHRTYPGNPMSPAEARLTSQRMAHLFRIAGLAIAPPLD
jgi:hypothetical protein